MIKRFKIVLESYPRRYSLARSIWRSAVRFWFKLSNVVIGDILILFLSLRALTVRPRRHHWAFPVHFIQKAFSDNVRAVFEHVKDDHTIVKIIFTQGQPIDIAAREDVLVADVASFRSLLLLAECQVAFVQHSLFFDFKIKNRRVRKYLLKTIKVVNLWHGSVFKYIQRQDTTAKALDECGLYSALIATSETDKLIMAAAFYPLDFKKIHITGLPRHDFLFNPPAKLPAAHQNDIGTITALAKGRKIIIYAPTYRETAKGGEYYDFRDYEINQLKSVLGENNAVLGFRMHYYKNSKVSYERHVDDDLLFNFGNEVISDMTSLIRYADLVITDYSSLFTEALLLYKPVIGFWFDYNSYMTAQRGFYYDLPRIFPSPICADFNSLLEMVKAALDNRATISEKYEYTRGLFNKYSDDENSKRVVEMIKLELLGKKVS
jgi:CDP-glycerol glycerophosphotransferase